MKCSSCEREIPSDSQFCQYCGHRTTEHLIWEYKVERIDIGVHKRQVISASDLLDNLNKWGEEGWELRNALLSDYKVARHFWGGIGIKSTNYLAILRRQRSIAPVKDG